ncbi:minor tail protein [Streptomyces phage Beuffert]|nr:minor tail protein [Streptomyces phage Beuffert]
MTTPSGPIQIEIVQAESPSVNITRTPPPGFSISSSGPQGAPGTQIFHVTGVPAPTLGLAGDYAIDTTSHLLYGPKTNTGWPSSPMDFNGPKGDKGDTGNTGSTGPANTLSIGTVTTGAAGSSASANITGSAPSQTLSLTIPRGNTGAAGIDGAKGDKGDTGAAGPANTLAIGTVTTGAAGSSASASITGTAPNQTLNLTIPRGNSGIDGTNNTLFARKTADEQVTSSTTVQDDDHLVIPLAANSVYAIDSFMMFDSDPAADIKFTFTGPTGSTLHYTSDGVSAGNSNNIGSIKMDVNAAGVETVLGGFVGTKTAIRPAGYIVTDGTAGNLTFRWAQNAVSATPTTVYANSWLRAQKMA